MYETLRLHPVKPWIFRQCMHKIKVDKKFIAGSRDGNVIEKNDIIAVHNYSLGRSEKLWSDPLTFEPKRFEDGKKKNNGYAFGVFGIGLRECMGKSMVLDAAKIYIFNILKDYDVVAKPGQTVTYTASTVLHMKQGLDIKLKRRQNEDQSP